MPKEYKSRIIYVLKCLWQNTDEEHEYAAPTYKDSPYLKEIAELVAHQTDDDAETLEEIIPALRFLNECYDKMCRAMDSCLECWNLKATYLADHGIRWCSPAQLNSKVKFD